MGLQDLVVTPLYLMLLYGLAYWIRPKVTNRDTRKYFIPALTAKFIGAISLGLVYQFYYGGGDTFNYYHLGSEWVWKAFLDSPSKAVSLLLAGTEYPLDAFEYATNIYFFGDLSSYFVVRVAGLFGLLTFNSYYSIAILFAASSFAGTWALYHALYKLEPRLAGKTAIAVLFIPSVFFWGSGLLKDSITFGAVGFFIYSLLELVVWRNRRSSTFVLLFVAAYLLYHVKIYIALSLVPGSLLFVYLHYFKTFVRNTVLRVLLLPLMLCVSGYSMYYAAFTMGQDDRKYSLEAMLNTAAVSAEWLSYVSRVQGGSGYTLGDDDFSPTGMARKFIPGVWVSLFRPYLWEVKNTVMLLTALESALLSGIVCYILLRNPPLKLLKIVMGEPLVMFFLIFTIIFSFAIGVSTFNFGTLARYRIPMLPLFVFVLFFIDYKLNSYCVNRKTEKPHFSTAQMVEARAL